MGEKSTNSRINNQNGNNQRSKNGWNTLMNKLLLVQHLCIRILCATAIELKLSARAGEIGFFVVGAEATLRQFQRDWGCDTWQAIYLRKET